MAPLPYFFNIHTDSWGSHRTGDSPVVEVVSGFLTDLWGSHRGVAKTVEIGRRADMDTCAEKAPWYSYIGEAIMLIMLVVGPSLLLATVAQAIYNAVRRKKLSAREEVPVVMVGVGSGEGEGEEKEKEIRS